jgi:hypothetical protein
LKEQRAKQERERKAREEYARRERELEEQEKHGKLGSVPSNLHPAPGTFLHQQSPHPQIATPVVPKTSTPVRPRGSSQQGSHSSSPRSQAASTEAAQLSPRSVLGSSVLPKHGPAHHPLLHHPYPTTPMSPLGRLPPPGLSPSNPPGLSGIVPRPLAGHELPTYPPHSSPFLNQHRGFQAPTGIPAHPGMNGTRPMAPGRGFPLEASGLPFHAQPPLPGAFVPQPPGGLPSSHSRQPSTSFERSPLDINAQPFPISRPSPIKRPPSTQQDHNSRKEMDELSAQLGSSALLDDTDIPLTSSQLSQSLPGPTGAAAMPGPARASFTGSSLFPTPLSAKHNNFPVGPAVGGNTWGAQMPFGTPTFPSDRTWGMLPGK